MDREREKNEGTSSTKIGEANEIYVDKLHTHGNILYQDSYSYHKWGSTGIKVPCRTLGEQKSFKRRNHFMATKKKAAKKKKH